MPTIPVGAAEWTLIFQCAGVDRDITWSHGFVGDNLPTTNPAALAEEIFVIFTTTGNPYAAGSMSNQWSILGCSVSYQTEEGPLVGQYLQTITGSTSTAPVPVNCAILFNKNTGAGGRRNRGRFYAPPTAPAESSIDAAGRMSGTLADAFDVQFGTVFGALESADYEMVLFHQTAPFTPTPVTGWSCNTLLATQRRRMRG